MDNSNTNAKRLNELANDAFLKAKKKLNFDLHINKALKSGAISEEQVPEINEKIRKCLENTDLAPESNVEALNKNEAKSIFSCIDSLELSSNLKIALTYMVSSMRNDKRENLNKAMEFIHDELKG